MQIVLRLRSAADHAKSRWVEGIEFYCGKIFDRYVFCVFQIYANLKTNNINWQKCMNASQESHVQD
jgi:hypothetical protein